ncbi:MAG: hypothetical protein HOP32_01260 [Nitrospira sp.]|nr:hypothetical protein [Nitrospira sp.]
MGWLRQRHLVMPMEKIGAESGNGTAPVERDRPEASYVISSRQLFFIHESEGTGKGF